MVNFFKASLFLVVATSVAATPTPKSTTAVEKRHHWTPIELVMYDLGKVDDNTNYFKDRAEKYTGGFWAAVPIAKDLAYISYYIYNADKNAKGLEPMIMDDSNTFMDMMTNKLDPDTEAALEALKGKKDLMEEKGHKDKVVSALTALQAGYSTLSQKVLEQIDESKSQDLQDVAAKLDHNIMGALMAFDEEEDPGKEDPGEEEDDEEEDDEDEGEDDEEKVSGRQG